MRDLDRGRLFLVAPEGHKYNAPKFNFAKLDEAASALKSPNMATRYLAWNRLNDAGAKAQTQLQDLWNSDNPVYRARALWLSERSKAANNTGLTLLSETRIQISALQESVLPARMVPT